MLPEKRQNIKEVVDIGNRKVIKYTNCYKNLYEEPILQESELTYDKQKVEEVVEKIIFYFSEEQIKLFLSNDISLKEEFLFCCNGLFSVDVNCLHREKRAKRLIHEFEINLQEKNIKEEVKKIVVDLVNLYFVNRNTLVFDRKMKRNIPILLKNSKFFVGRFNWYVRFIICITALLLNKDFLKSFNQEGATFKQHLLSRYHLSFVIDPLKKIEHDFFKFFEKNSIFFDRNSTKTWTKLDREEFLENFDNFLCPEGSFLTIYSSLGNTFLFWICVNGRWNECQMRYMFFLRSQKNRKYSLRFFLISDLILIFLLIVINCV